MYAVRDFSLRTSVGLAVSPLCKCLQIDDGFEMCPLPQRTPRAGCSRQPEILARQFPDFLLYCILFFRIGACIIVLS